MVALVRVSLQIYSNVVAFTQRMCQNCHLSIFLWIVMTEHWLFSSLTSWIYSNCLQCFLTEHTLKSPGMGWCYIYEMLPDHVAMCHGFCWAAHLDAALCVFWSLRNKLTRVGNHSLLQQNPAPMTGVCSGSFFFVRCSFYLFCSRPYVIGWEMLASKHPALRIIMHLSMLSLTVTQHAVSSYINPHYSTRAEYILYVWLPRRKKDICAAPFSKQLFLWTLSD